MQDFLLCCWLLPCVLLCCPVRVLVLQSRGRRVLSSTRPEHSTARSSRAWPQTTSTARPQPAGLGAAVHCHCSVVRTPVALHACLLARQLQRHAWRLSSSSPGTMAFRQLDTAEKKALQDQWHMIDTSGDGKLDMAETCEFLDALKHKMSPEQKAAAFKEMDMDGSGSVMVSLQPAHQGGVLTHGWVAVLRVLRVVFATGCRDIRQADHARRAEGLHLEHVGDRGFLLPACRRDRRRRDWRRRAPDDPRAPSLALTDSHCCAEAEPG